MRYTHLTLAMLAGLLAGCTTICGDQGNSTVRTASVQGCPTCLDQLVFIRKDLAPIGGPLSQSGRDFAKAKNACIVKLKAKHPALPASRFAKIDQYMADNITNDSVMLMLINEMKVCMAAQPIGYGLVGVLGRSSG